MLCWPDTVRGVRDLVGVVCAVLVGVGVAWAIGRFSRSARRDVEAREELEARRAAGLPDTEHTVEIWEIAEDGPPFLMALCADDGCDWMEFPPKDTTYGEQEQPLRAVAKSHGTAVTPGIRRITDP